MKFILLSILSALLFSSAVHAQSLTNWVTTPVSTVKSKVGSSECTNFNVINNNVTDAYQYKMDIFLNNVAIVLNASVGLPISNQISASQTELMILGTQGIPSKTSFDVRVCYNLTKSTAVMNWTGSATLYGILKPVPTTSTVSKSTTTTRSTTTTTTRSTTTTTRPTTTTTTTTRPSTTTTTTQVLTTTRTTTTTASSTTGVSGSGSENNSTDPIMQKLNAGKLVVAYWGQQSASNEADLLTFCKTGDYDVMIVSFIDKFLPSSNPPFSMNLAGHCWNFFSGSASKLLNCPSIGTQIKQCQALGVKVLVSVGGWHASVGFASTAIASNIATQIWNTLLGGSSQYRPFGDAIVDGIDLDIENGSPNYYDTFMNTLHTLTKADKSKAYYLTGAPQCYKPDLLDNTAWK